MYRSGCVRASTRRSSPRSAAANANAAVRLPTPGGPCSRYACAGPSVRAAARRRIASGCSGTSAKRAIDLLRELLGRASGIQDHDPLRKSLRELPVAGVDARVKVVALPFEPVALSRQTAPDRARIEQEQEGSVRHQPLDRREVQVEDALEPETARDSLVRDGGVDVAIADHRCAASERGPDHLLDELRTRRRIEEGLGPRSNVTAVQDEVAELLPQLRPAGLTREDGFGAVRLEPRLEQLRLRRLARAVDAFERHEHRAPS